MHIIFIINLKKMNQEAVFLLSKINLNISKANIHLGINVF